MGRKERSDGYEHAKISLVGGIGIAAIGLTGGIIWPVVTAPALVAALGVVAGAVLSPDLDQPMITWSEWFVIKLLPPLSWIPGLLMVGYWLPYSLMMKHRGVSHWPVIGTLTRIAYMLPIGYLTHILFMQIDWYAKNWQNLGPWVLFFCIGLAISDVGHYLRDYHGLKVG